MQMRPFSTSLVAALCVTFACSSGTPAPDLPNDGANFNGHALKVQGSGGTTFSTQQVNATGTDTASGRNNRGDTIQDNGSSNNDAEITALLADCGFPGGQLPDPSTVLFQKSMRSLPVTIQGSKAIDASSLGIPLFGVLPISLPPANYTAVVRANVNVSASMSGGKQSLRANLESFNVQVAGFQVPPSTGQADAQKEIQANNSDSSSTGPDSNSQFSMVTGEGPWKGIFCTLSPTSSITSTRNGKTTTVEFDPPIPGGVWFKAVPKRYDDEIGSGKTFTNVTATISKSSDSSLPVGTKVTGKVTVTPVSGNLSDLSLNTERAFKITTDFGPRTVDLGLTLSQTFYVSTSGQDLKAIVIQTGNSQIPRLVVAPGI